MHVELWIAALLSVALPFRPAVRVGGVAQSPFPRCPILPPIVSPVSLRTAAALPFGYARSGSLQIPGCLKPSDRVSLLASPHAESPHARFATRPRGSPGPRPALLPETRTSPPLRSGSRARLHRASRSPVVRQPCPLLPGSPAPYLPSRRKPARADVGVIEESGSCFAAFLDYLLSLLYELLLNVENRVFASEGRPRTTPQGGSARTPQSRQLLSSPNT